MKKINLLIIFVLAGLIGLNTGCKNDPDDFAAPSITFTVGTQDVDEGDQVEMVFKVSTEAELTKVRMYIDDVQFGETITEFGNKQLYSFNEVVDSAAAETFVFKVIAEDDQGKLSDEEVTVTVTPVSGGTLTEFTVTLGDQGDTEGSFLDASTGTRYTQADANTNSALIDIIHYFGTSNEGTLCAPNDATVNGGEGNLSLATGMSTQNATKFSLDNTADYDAATYESVGTGGDAATASLETELEPDDLVYFKTVDGISGIIKIGAYGKNAKGIKTVGLTYKIQVPNPTK